MGRREEGGDQEGRFPQGRANGPVAKKALENLPWSPREQDGQTAGLAGGRRALSLAWHPPGLAPGLPPPSPAQVSRRTGSGAGSAAVCKSLPRLGSLGSELPVGSEPTLTSHFIFLKEKPPSFTGKGH